MPMRKFALVAERLRDFPQIAIVPPDPVTADDLLRVHHPEYVTAIRTGVPRELAESQKFPWSPALYPSVLLTNGGVLAAAKSALESGVSGALASGFHHAGAGRGEGFCTFNGLAVALEALRAQNAIRTGAVLDLDLHYGNGTASLAAERPWMKALSIYGNDYAENQPFRNVSVRHHEDGPGHFSVPIAPSGGPDGPRLLQILRETLPWLIQDGPPDVLLYQAGADPLRDDPYSPLALTHDDLFARDKLVFDFARDHRIPVAWVLAGGYSPDIQKIIDVHVNTARACLDSYCFS